MQTGLIVLHLIGSAIWAGGLIVLAFALLPRIIRAGDPGAVRDLAAGFEPWAIAALVLQVVTGVVLALDYMPSAEGESLSGHVAGLLGTKMILLLASLGHALYARLVLVPRLGQAGHERAPRKLRGHLIALSGIAVLFIVVGASFRAAG